MLLNSLSNPIMRLSYREQMTPEQTLTVTVPISMSSFLNAVYRMPPIVNSSINTLESGIEHINSCLLSCSQSYWITNTSFTNACTLLDHTNISLSTFTNTSFTCMYTLRLY